MTTAPHVPAPPQGPGVYPPFPAPPVEGRGRRIGLGLGIGAGVVALVCGGGIAAGIGVIASGADAIQEQAHAVVRDYLDALHDGKYDKAYDMLCKDSQRFESETAYNSRMSAMTPIASYTLGDLNVVTLAVPVEATYENGQVGDLEAQLGQDDQTGALQVCELG
jgi:hypothetical protein